MKEPTCRSCGSELRIDRNVKARNKRLVCKCDGYMYPHRAGTEPWCQHAKIGPSEADYEERYRHLMAS